MCFSTRTCARATQGVGAMATQGVKLHRDFWHVQRLLYIAMTKESTTQCPLSLAKTFPGLVPIVTDFLCTPLCVLAHPRAEQGCKCCHTPVCEACQQNEISCCCGCNDIRWLRGGTPRTVPCKYAQRLSCYVCLSTVRSRAASRCAQCGTVFRPAVEQISEGWGRRW